MAPSQFLVAALVRWFERMGIRDGRLLVAVSGGLDSVALLQLLNRVKETAPAIISHLSVAHIDHRFREESVDDARFVNGVSAALGLDFYCEALPERPPKTNLEAWARKERYERLEHFRQRSNCEWIVTAHHQDDLIETLLFRAGSNRLFTSLHTIDEVDSKRHLIRPLLSFRKIELAEFAREMGIIWVEDRTNQDRIRTRNFLRHEVIPRIEAIDSSLFSTLVEVATSFNESELALRSFADALADAVKKRQPKNSGSALQISCPQQLLQQLPGMLRIRLVNSLISAFGPFKTWERLLGESALIQLNRVVKGETRKAMLGHGVVAELRAEFVNFAEDLSGSSEPSTVLVHSLEELLERGVPGWCVGWRNAKNGAGEFEVRIADPLGHTSQIQAGKTEQSCVCVLFPISGLEFPITIRTRRDGDIIRVKGRGRRKVKKLFQEQGLMLTVRDTIPIVEDSRRILWIPGVAASDISLAPASAPLDAVLKSELDQERATELGGEMTNSFADCESVERVCGRSSLIELIFRPPNSAQ